MSLRGGAAPKAGVVRPRDPAATLVAMVERVLERGAAAGLFRAGLDPVQLNISIAALGYYYLTNRYTSPIIFGLDLGAKEMPDRRRAVIVDTILRYVMRDPATLDTGPAG